MNQSKALLELAHRELKRRFIKSVGFPYNLELLTMIAEMCNHDKDDELCQSCYSLLLSSLLLEPSQ